MIKRTQTSFAWNQHDWSISQLHASDDAFELLFKEMNNAHLKALAANWKAEAQAVAGDVSITDAELWSSDDTDALQAQVEKLVTLTCRMCLLQGHEASYCPFNAQMNRVCAAAPETHALWKRWRIARSQHVKNVAAKEAMLAASRASKSRADSMASVSSAAAAAFGQ